MVCIALWGRLCFRCHLFAMVHEDRQRHLCHGAVFSWLEGGESEACDEVIDWVGLKLHSCGVEAMFLRGRSYVLVGSKLCSQCCNAVEKDRSLSREWLKSTQRTIICKAVKTSVGKHDRYSWCPFVLFFLFTYKIMDFQLFSLHHPNFITRFVGWTQFVPLLDFITATRGGHCKRLLKPPRISIHPRYASLLRNWCRP